MKFKSDIEVQSGLKDFAGASGTSGQVLSSTGSGVSWITPTPGGVTSFNTRTGAVTLTSTDVTTALGYTAANDANVVHKTGDESITGIKSFNYSYSGVENFTTRLNYFFDNGFIRSNVIPIETIDNLTSQSIFRVDGTGSVRANSFVKIGGTASQYLMADGSVKTTVVARNETTFTTTSDQTTFAVDYSPGQVDVFYNGSKLNISEFTATDGTSVILGFACAAGESIVIDSYVNQISGASGTADRIAKFTGAASLGDSQMYDNGSSVSVGSPVYIGKFNVIGSMYAGSMFFNNGNISTAGSTFISLSTNSSERLRVNTNGNVLIGTTTDNGNRLRVNGNSSFSGNVSIGTTSSASKLTITGADSGSAPTYLALNNTAAGAGVGCGLQIQSNGVSVASLDWAYDGSVFNSNLSAFGNLVFKTNGSTERVRITSGGNVLIGNTADSTALARSIILDNGSNCGIVFKNAGNNKGYLYNSASELYLETTGGVVYVMAGVNGVRLNNGATSWTSNSDSRLKNINYTIENAVDKLCTLNPISFTWKSDESKKEVLGLIAQDVEKVFPQVIDKNKLSKGLGDESKIDETEYLGVRYQELIPVLVKAIQELKAEIEILKNK